MKGPALAGVALSTLLVAAAYVLAFVPRAPGAVGAVLLAVGTAGLLASLLVLGAARSGAGDPGAPRHLWLPVATTLLAVGGGLGALVLLPPADLADPALLLGLPPRAALLLYGVGLLPALVVPAAYALGFERFTLSRDDLERVREAGRKRRAEEAADRGPLEDGAP